MPVGDELTSAAPDDTYSNTWRALGITFSNILTQDDAMRRSLELARQAAQSDIAVLILGETGTGKTLVAQAIHNASRRREGPFVSANCAGLPDTLVETELFGHEAGAFTDARRSRVGHFERANGGTLFLDEIGDMSLLAQQKVLHAFEHKQFYRVGGERMLSVDVRFILATHQPLDELVIAKQFRADLYYRIRQCPIMLPPLRARKAYIPLYVEAFLDEANDRYGTRVRKLSRASLSLMSEHDWPGNVRELRAVVHNAAQLCRKAVIEPRDLNLTVRYVDDEPAPVVPQASPPVAAGEPSPVHSGEIRAELQSSSAPLPALSSDLTLDALERAHIQRVLGLTQGNKKEAARLLGISRPTLDRKIKRYGLHLKDRESDEHRDSTAR